jgi:hypothetical protein
MYPGVIAAVILTTLALIAFIGAEEIAEMRRRKAAPKKPEPA